MLCSCGVKLLSPSERKDGQCAFCLHMTVHQIKLDLMSFVGGSPFRKPPEHEEG